MAPMDVYGLIGNPVGHSLSPPMQQAGFDELGIDATYVTFEPEPSNVQSAIAGAEALGISGLNVTIPFKEAVMDAVTADEIAQRIGAINTIDFTEDPPMGTNTDVVGVIRSFRYHDVTITGRNAVVVGAGGAGRAVAFALADAGATVSIVNRTVSTARSLAADVPSATAHGLDALAELLSDADILVNATSVGMESDESVIPAEMLDSQHTVMDAVYRPLETRLLKDANAAGATTIDGAWMLLFQGVESFERWTGVDAPVEQMNNALRTSLGT